MLCLLVLAAGFLQEGRASAQSACAQLGVNCNLPSPPPASPPQCYDPTTGAAVSCSYQAPSSTPRTSTPRTPAPQSSATILNNAIQQQVVGAVMQGFFQMLFSNDSQADAQKQQMMQELQLRQAEAEKQHNIEEAQRLAAICNRLQATLKLTGVPELQLKNGGGGGLQLKLGDSDSGHVGVRGLPGIYLDHSSGSSGNSSGQIVNYVTEPLSAPTPPSGSGPLTGGALQLKTGEDGAATAPAASVPIAPPAPVEGTTAARSSPPAEGALPADTIADVRNMTPQQLADLATKISNLPPEEQRRLMDAARNSAPSPAGGAANSSPAGAAASQPAQSQLQQIASTSQSAATAASPEDAAVLARSGFDTPGRGTVHPAVVISGTTVAPIPAPTSIQAQATTRSNAPLPPAHSPARASAPTYPVVPLLNMASSSGGSAANDGATPTPDRHESADTSCPPGVAKLVPSRQQLETELAMRQAQMESLRSTILRMDRSIQLNQQQFAVWQDEASATIDRLKGEIWDKATDFAFDNFLDSEEEHIKEAPISEAQRADKLRRLELAKNIKDFDDFREWALSNQDDWGMIEDGMRSLVDYLPLDAGPLAYVHCAEDLIDNAYDLTDFVATWNNVQQLDHNSDQFLQAVRMNGERVTALVRRIQQIKTQLNAAPVGPTGAPACRSVTAGMK